MESCFDFRDKRTIVQIIGGVQLIRDSCEMVVIPAKAGIQSLNSHFNGLFETWTPAFAGVTTLERHFATVPIPIPLPLAAAALSTEGSS